MTLINLCKRDVDKLAKLFKNYKLAIVSRGRLSKICNTNEITTAVEIKDERSYKIKSCVHEETL